MAKMRVVPDPAPVDDDEASTEETKRERFLRLAPKRVQEAVHRLKIVGNCAGYGYEYTPDEIKQIMDKLFDSVEPRHEEMPKLGYGLAERLNVQPGY